MKYDVNKTGYYGNFGGSHIPEMLYSNIEELNKNYLSIINTKSFNENFNYFLKHYVGRPTPLYFAKRLSKKYGSKIYLHPQKTLFLITLHMTKKQMAQIICYHRILVK